MRQMMEMDGDWCEERPTLIDSYGWALNPECFYLNLPSKSIVLFHFAFGVGPGCSGIVVAIHLYLLMGN